MSEVNIDTDLIQHGESNFCQTEEKLVEMSNGCICCTLREDLLLQVRDLANEGKFDYLLIESTGISGPLPVAATFDFRDQDGQSFPDVSRLDTMVTVVDAANLISNYSSTNFIKDSGESLGEEDERTLVDLLVEQIEFANVIVLNKTDLISVHDLEIVKAIIRGLNTRARIIETSFSKVPLSEVIDTGLFQFEEAQKHPLWPQELYNFKDHAPETEEYGITSFVYRAREPFSPLAVYRFFNQPWPGVIRSKGFFWIGSRPDSIGEVSQAGAFVRHRLIGKCLVSAPKSQWPNGPDLEKILAEHWNEEFGDRRQEIVFIGLKAEMNIQEIKEQLDAYFIEDYPSYPKKYQNIHDPFPSWLQGLPVN